MCEIPLHPATCDRDVHEQGDQDSGPDSDLHHVSGDSERLDPDCGFIRVEEQFDCPTEDGCYCVSSTPPPRSPKSAATTSGGRVQDPSSVTHSPCVPGLVQRLHPPTPGLSPLAFVVHPELLSGWYHVWTPAVCTPPRRGALPGSVQHAPNSSPGRPHLTFNRLSQPSGHCSLASRSY